MQTVALPAFFLFFFIAFCYIDFCSSSPMQICDASVVLPQLKPGIKTESVYCCFSNFMISVTFITISITSHYISTPSSLPYYFNPPSYSFFTFLKPKIPFLNFMNQGTIVCTSSLTNELDHPLIYVFPYFQLDIINISSKTVNTWSAFFWSIGHE